MDEARLQETLERITAQMRAAEERGAPADYIPELAKAPMDGFAIAVALADGRIVSAGDVDSRFTIQSISKIFTLALALGRRGDQLWRRVGREPSGDPFNSGILLEQEDGRPRNPFINAGAIVTTDTVLSGRAPRDALAEILTFVRGLAEDQNIHIDKAVARSEREHGFRNFALAYLLKEAGNLENPVDLVLGTYFHHCAIDMTTPQLAAAGRFLIEGKSLAPLLSSVRVRSINALMMTCGQYDGSGEFAFRVGLPAKSGVGGGILAVVPRRASIAVWSPGLNRYGNSLLGTRAIELVAAEYGWSVF